MNGNRTSLESLAGWWYNPFAINGSVIFVKGEHVYVNNVLDESSQLKIGSGRKLTLGKYSGVVRNNGTETEISWDKDKIVWRYIGELPDKYGPDTKQGRFKYTKVLGKGANGVVCEAIDMQRQKHDSRETVAIKVLWLSDEISCKKLKYKAALRLQSEYVWSHLFLHNTRHEHYNSKQGSLFLQYFEDHTGLPAASEATVLSPDRLQQREPAPLPYVVMELAKGSLAWKALFENPDDGSKAYSTSDRREIVRQLASALDYLEKFDLLHRDLHFHNIFLSRDKGLSVTIGDLGMMSRPTNTVYFVPYDEEGWKMRDWVPWEAWNLTDTKSRRSSGPTRGRAASPYFQQQSLDGNWQAVDVFALGVIHLYLCLGQEEARRILACIRADQHPSLDCESSKRLILDSDLAIRMVSKDPNGRPTTSEVLDLVPKTGLSYVLSWFYRPCASRASRPRSRSRSRSPRRQRSRALGSSSRRCAYLPTELNGVRVLEREAGNKWRVTDRNFRVKPRTDGLGRRKSKDIDDHMGGNSAVVKWGEVVVGVDEDDGWVRCEL